MAFEFPNGVHLPINKENKMNKIKIIKKSYTIVSGLIVTTIRDGKVEVRYEY